MPLASMFEQRFDALHCSVGRQWRFFYCYPIAFRLLGREAVLSRIVTAAGGGGLE